MGVPAAVDVDPAAGRLPGPARPPPPPRHRRPGHEEPAALPSASQCQAPDVHAPQHRIENPERRDTPFGELLVVPRRLTDRRHSEVPILMDPPARLGLLSHHQLPQAMSPMAPALANPAAHVNRDDTMILAGGGAGWPEHLEPVRARSARPDSMSPMIAGSTSPDRAPSRPLSTSGMMPEST